MNFRKVVILLAAALAFGGLANPQTGESQDAESQNGESQNGESQNGESQNGEKEFYARLSEWRDIIVEMRLAKREHINAPTFDESVECRERYEKARAAGDKKIQEIKQAAAKAYVENPKAGTEYHDFLRNSLRLDLEQREDLTSSLLISEALDTKPIQIPDLSRLVGMTLFYHQQFDRAEKLLKYAQSRNAIGSSAAVLQLIPRMKIQWERELEFRKKDESAKLPRAVFETTKGQFVVELFEDQAPNTVKNFVKLVESGYYKDLEFFMVQPFSFALSGSPTNQLSSSAFVLKNEGKDPEKRRGNFRGSICALARGENNEHVDASLFMLTFTPYPDGSTDKYCNFGRVISGMENVDRLNRSIDMEKKPIEGFSPDKIINVTIENKRDHDYEPSVLRAQ